MEFTQKSKIKRYKERASYNENDLNYILSKTLYCNVSFCEDGQPTIIPMNFVYFEKEIYIHGSPESRIIKELSKGKNIALSFVYIENIAKAESLCNYSMNYASAVVFGHSSAVLDKNIKMKILIELGKKVDPEGYKNAIPPGENEMDNVALVRVDIEEFSLKSRIGFKF